MRADDAMHGDRTVSQGFTQFSLDGNIRSFIFGGVKTNIMNIDSEGSSKS